MELPDVLDPAGLSELCRHCGVECGWVSALALILEAQRSLNCHSTEVPGMLSSAILPRLRMRSKDRSPC